MPRFHSILGNDYRLISFNTLRTFPMQRMQNCRSAKIISSRKKTILLLGKSIKIPSTATNAQNKILIFVVPLNAYCEISDFQVCVTSKTVARNLMTRTSNEVYRMCSLRHRAFSNEKSFRYHIHPINILQAIQWDLPEKKFNTILPHIGQHFTFHHLKKRGQSWTH